MLIVEKYGGSSVSTPRKIKLISNHIKQSVEQKNKLVVVVSAMGKTTNKLIGLAEKFSAFPDKKSQDVLLCTGEMQTIALITIALKEQKVNATLLCGFQAKIKTTSNFGKAKIKDIDTSKIKKLLKTFDVIVVAGFQGIDTFENLTTLGRGGSDTTAVALAAKLKCPCFVYTDVKFVFKANPKTVKNPKPLKQININTMLEMADCGAKVLDTRCLEIAKKFNVPLFLGKSLSKTKGSKICMSKNFENPSVEAICEKDDLTIFEIKNTQNYDAKIFDVLEKQNENVFVFQKLKQTICFAIAKNNAKKVEIMLKNTLKNAKIKTFENFCCVSLVGFGFATHPKISQEIFLNLAKNKIFAKQTTISETKISITLKAEEKQKAVNILAKLFGVQK